MLRAFDSQEWLLDFHKSLAYLQQMDRVERVNGRYTMTVEGRRRLEEINDAPELGIAYEAQQIRDMAERVRTGLDL